MQNYAGIYDYCSLEMVYKSKTSIFLHHLTYIHLYNSTAKEEWQLSTTIMILARMTIICFAAEMDDKS